MLSRRQTIITLAACCALASAARAQNVAHIGYVYPAGGRQGTTFSAIVGGQYLDGATEVYISGSGVSAKVVEHVKPLTQGQANKLREQLMELQKKRTEALRSGKKRGGASGSPASAKSAWTAEDAKLFEEIRKKLATFVRKPAAPAIAETVSVEVTLAPDAELGQRELRLAARGGLTNPLVFCVGQLPECSEQRLEQSARANYARKRSGEEHPGSVQNETSVTLPAVINGQILPGEVDRFRFPARKGQRLVIAAAARQLIPYLADAVPGWFQATLALYDSKGNELAYDDDFRFNPDPVLYYKIPLDGDYLIEIKDAIYRGREDFVYRITAGEIPFVTHIFPLGGPAGAETTVELKGWNLPVSKLTLDDKAKPPGVYPLAVRKNKWLSNGVPFAVDTLPECLEQEPNNEPAAAQRVALPVIVNGRIDRPGDWDVFCFQGRAGSQIVAEVLARRLNSPLDSLLKLTDAAGRQLAFNDDHEDKSAGLLTHYADSWLSATLPADGLYYLHLGDAQHQGGPEYGYRLRISPPRPDFQLRVAPSSVNVRAGGTVAVTVYALRADGFSGDIALALKDAPKGFSLSGGHVPAGQDEVRLTLTAPPTAASGEPVSLNLEGRATIAGQEVSHPAVPTENMTQAFEYRHLVPERLWEVAVLGRGTTKANRGQTSTAVRILDEMPLTIPAGGTARVRVGVAPFWLFNKATYELSDPPEGITIKDVSTLRDSIEIVLQCDGAKAKPGLNGNLIVVVSPNRSTTTTKTKTQSNQRNTPTATLPAIPFRVAGR